MDDVQKQKLEQEVEIVKEEGYKFFYDIWPTINRVLNFIFYTILKVSKGFARIVMDQFRSK